MYIQILSIASDYPFGVLQVCTGCMPGVIMVVFIFVDSLEVGRVLSTLPSASNSFCGVLSNAKGTQQLISEEDSESVFVHL